MHFCEVCPCPTVTTNGKNLFSFTLGPAYNEQFDAQKCARSSRVLVVTELLNIAVNE